MLLNNRRDKLIAYEDVVRQETRKEIREHLTNDQQPQFDTLVTQHDADRKKQEAQ